MHTTLLCGAISLQYNVFNIFFKVNNAGSYLLKHAQCSVLISFSGNITH